MVLIFAVVFSNPYNKAVDEVDAHIVWAQLVKYFAVAGSCLLVATKGKDCQANLLRERRAKLFSTRLMNDSSSESSVDSIQVSQKSGASRSVTSRRSIISGNERNSIKEDE